jgi:hypothetical protein
VLEATQIFPRKDLCDCECVETFLVYLRDAVMYLLRALGYFRIWHASNWTVRSSSETTRRVAFLHLDVSRRDISFGAARSQMMSDENVFSLF